MKFSLGKILRINKFSNIIFHRQINGKLLLNRNYLFAIFSKSLRSWYSIAERNSTTKTLNEIEAFTMPPRRQFARTLWLDYKVPKRGIRPRSSPLITEISIGRRSANEMIRFEEADSGKLPPDGHWSNNRACPLGSDICRTLIGSFSRTYNTYIISIKSNKTIILHDIKDKTLIKNNSENEKKRKEKSTNKRSLRDKMKSF